MILLHLHTWNSAFKSPPGYSVCYDTFLVHNRSLFFHAFYFSFENIHTSLHTSYQARPSRRWLISSSIFTSVSWLKSLRGGRWMRDSGLCSPQWWFHVTHLSPPLMKLFILRDLDSGVLTWELSPNILSAVLLIGRISFSEKILWFYSAVCPSYLT